MLMQDLTSYENDKSRVTVFMETDTDGSYHFLKHVQDKKTEDGQIIRYSLEMFMAEYYLIEKFIKDNLVEDRKFFKSVMNLKASRNE
jgi:hypothetical protein